MALSERTLRKWRKEALEDNKEDYISTYKDTAKALARSYMYNLDRILQMTQELLDQHLLRK